MAFYGAFGAKKFLREHASPPPALGRIPEFGSGIPLNVAHAAKILNS